MNITVFLGAPGSGKGTQAKKLSQLNGFRHFSTGDMLRAAIQAGSDVGLKAKAFIDSGELVNDQTMIELIEEALGKLPADANVILDGFPRTVPQAQALDKKSSTAVNRAIYFVVPHNDLIQRLTGRRICEKCGEPFHVINLPAKTEGVCDRCGGKLIQRKDDSEDVVKRRLEIFAEQNDQLLSYYRYAGKLTQIEADKPIATLQATILKMLQ